MAIPIVHSASPRFTFAKHAMTTVLNFLLPYRCPWCRNNCTAHADSLICPRCFHAIQWSPGMWRSTRVPIHCDSIHAAALFQGAVRSAIHAFKYNKQPFLAKSCAAVMVPFARGLPTPDFVIPVPLSQKRLRERRYNQSALLAQQVAKMLGVAVAVDLVDRLHADVNQVGLDAKARWENVQRQFTTTHKATAQIKGSRILVVDDVITTGATLNALAQVLKKSGATSVRALTLAQTI